MKNKILKLIVVAGIIISILVYITIRDEIEIKEEIEFNEMTKRETINFLRTINTHFQNSFVISSIMKKNYQVIDELLKNVTYTDDNDDFFKIFDDTIQKLLIEYYTFSKLSKLFRRQTPGALANTYVPYISANHRHTFEIVAELISLYQYKSDYQYPTDVKFNSSAKFKDYPSKITRKWDSIYAIFAKGDTTSIKVASPKQFHFPVFFIEPMEGNENAVLIDLYSNPNRKIAIQDALDGNVIRCTSPIRLVQTTNGDYSTICFNPCQYPSPDLTNVVFSIPKLLRESIISKSGLIGSSVSLFDAGSYNLNFQNLSPEKLNEAFEADVSDEYSRDAINNMTLIASYQVSNDGSFVPFSPDDAHYRNIKRFAYETLYVGGRRWIFQIALAYSNSKNNDFNIGFADALVPFLVLFATLIISGLYAFSMYKHQQHVHMLRYAEERAQNKFIAYLCHELRNPLHALNNLTSDFPVSERNEETVKLMKATVGHLSDLVSSFIDVSLTFESIKNLDKTELEDDDKYDNDEDQQRRSSFAKSDNQHDSARESRDLDAESSNHEGRRNITRRNSTRSSLSIRKRDIYIKRSSLGQSKKAAENASQIRINPKTCDFSTIVRDAFYQHRVLFADTALFDLSISDTAKSIVADFDPIRVRQILSNTIGNVAKQGNTGVINVFVDRVDIGQFHAVIVCVSDSQIIVTDIRNMLLMKHRIIPFNGDYVRSEISNASASTVGAPPRITNTNSNSNNNSNDDKSKKHGVISLFSSNITILPERMRSNTSESAISQSPSPMIGAHHNSTPGGGRQRSHSQRSQSRGWEMAEKIGSSFRIRKASEETEKSATTWDIGVKLSQYLVKRMNGKFYMKNPDDICPYRFVAFSIPFTPQQPVETTSIAAPKLANNASDYKASTQSSSTSIATSPTNNNIITVFACDDDPVNRSILHRLLTKKLGIFPENLHMFESGTGLLEYIDQLSPLNVPINSVFFIDFYMDGIQGNEVCEEIHKRGISSPIYATTGSASQSDIGTSFTGVIQKPYSAEDLSEALQTRRNDATFTIISDVSIV